MDKNRRCEEPTFKVTILRRKKGPGYEPWTQFLAAVLQQLLFSIMSRYLKTFNLSFLRNSFPVFGSEVDQRGRLSAAVVDAARNLPDVEPDQNVKKNLSEAVLLHFIQHLLSICLFILRQNKCFMICASSVCNSVAHLSLPVLVFRYPNNDGEQCYWDGYLLLGSCQWY